MASRENILNRIRTNIQQQYDKPEVNIQGITYDDILARFIFACENISKAQVSYGTPPEEGVDADTATVRGDIAVAENGCVWIPQRVEDRSPWFKSEHLNIIISKDCIVDNMHQAYERIEASEEYFKDYKFGTFISGPSKTADIEGALVYGAQAARSLTVFIT